jgi:hypothetical protein
MPTPSPARSAICPAVLLAGASIIFGVVARVGEIKEEI